MHFRFKSLSLLAISVIATGCAQVTTQSEPLELLTDNNFNSTLWVQTAGEYRANALQVYNAAIGNLNAITRLSKLLL